MTKLTQEQIIKSQKIKQEYERKHGLKFSLGNLVKEINSNLVTRFHKVVILSIPDTLHSGSNSCLYLI